MTYNEYKEQLIKQYNQQPEFDYDRTPLNEVARLLMEFKGKQMADSRVAARALKKASTNAQPSIPEANGVEVDREAVKDKLTNLSGLVPLDSDLAEFKGVNKDILRVYLVNQDISPKKLANSFGVSYQSVAGLLNSKAVQILRAKYFHKQLDNNTKIGLLKLTEDADPKIVLAAADYLKILHEKDKDDDSASRIQDPKAEKALLLLGDWLSGTDETLTIQRKDLV